MKQLWSPWRIEHVTGTAKPVAGCLFKPCNAGSRKYDRERLLLFQDKRGTILLNRFPYANGHLLVAPSAHVSCITQLNSNESSDLMALIQLSAAILQKHLQPDGLNIGCNIGEVAGAGIADHLHFHIVPRWQHDHNFMTVISEIRSIPEHIQQTFDTLLPDFLNI